MRSILSVISTILATCALIAPAPTVAAPGDLDTATFGSGFGMVMTLIGSGSAQSYAVALQPDGKIVLAGTCGLGNSTDFCLARYQANGWMDLDFGPNGTGTVISPIGSFQDFGFTVALQPDGKIVVTGACWNGSNYDFCLARYQASGTLDPSFGSGGTVISPIGSDNDLGLAIALQPDGKIVVGGYCKSGSNNFLCLARYRANGTLDPDFDGDGKLISTFGTTTYIENSAIALQPDGKIIVAGSCVSGSDNDFCLARYQANGAIDTSFGSGGKVTTPIGSSQDYGYAVALQPDGKIVVAGSCVGSSNLDFCLARYNTGGTLDVTFGSSGKVTTAIGSPTSQEYGFAVAVLPDGKIVVAGKCSGDFCLARYHASGTPDTNFGSGGTVTTPIGPATDNGLAMALQPDGKIIVAGYCANNYQAFCLARYHGGPFGYQNCKLDIDGDGVVLATTDMLIGTRVALGMTGSAVINGISFASHATRKTWPDIRNYLVTQCGMTLAP